MHATSLENMQKCYERYLCRSKLLDKPIVRIADIGGANVNGSYADIFSHVKFEYTAVDVQAGPGIDIVLENPYVYPFDDNTIDVVVSGQTLEHVEFFWKSFEEMVRVLAPDGMIFLIVPSSGPIHRFPVDCYRFNSDAMRALARYTGVALIDSWTDDRGPWMDVVGVFARNMDVLIPCGRVGIPVNRYLDEVADAPLFRDQSLPEENVVRGRESYLEALRRVHEFVEPRVYLEIGVRRGASLALSLCDAVAVDPDPDVSVILRQNQSLYRETSDLFFENEVEHVFRQRRPDLVFIDGMHLFEFALRDFMNAERYSLPTTLIVIDDIYPNHPVQAQRKRRSRVWAGDIWKLYHCLRAKRPDLLLIPLDAAPTGLLLVAGLDAASRVLPDLYNPLIRNYRNMPLDMNDDTVFGRSEAVAPDDRRVLHLLNVLKENRDTTMHSGLGQLLKQVSGV